MRITAIITSFSGALILLIGFFSMAGAVNADLLGDKEKREIRALEELLGEEIEVPLMLRIDPVKVLEQKNQLWVSTVVSVIGTILFIGGLIMVLVDEWFKMYAMNKIITY